MAGKDHATTKEGSMTPNMQRVHDLYWNRNYNCARTMLACLGATFGTPIAEQTFQAATGMHGAGRFRAQCGLVEGALMFIGIAAASAGRSDKDIETLCYRFAEAFTGRFGSLLCRELRPGGFQPSDPPHACEKLTVEAVDFTENFLKEALFSPRQA